MAQFVNNLESEIERLDINVKDICDEPAEEG